MERREMTIDCSGVKHIIYVAYGEKINPMKICKRFRRLEINKDKHEQKKHNSQNGY
jgi:hypothetical protein